MIVEDYFPYKTVMQLTALEDWNYNEIPVLLHSQFDGIEEIKLSAINKLNW